MQYCINLYEQQHDKTNNMTCAPSKDSDQPEHPLRPRFLYADSEDSDQTGQMPRLIWVFAGQTDIFFGCVTLQLILKVVKCEQQPSKGFC